MAYYLDTWGMNDFYNFFIYAENGNLIYKNCTNENIDNSIQGILQAMYFTGDDYSFKLRSLATDFGILAFKLFDINKFFPNNKKNNSTAKNAINNPPSSGSGSSSITSHDKNILLCLIYPNFFGDEELSDFLMERILDYVFDILVIHIGTVDLFSTNAQEVEKLKKQLDLFQPTLDYILKNFSNLDFIFKSEKKLEVARDVLYPIKHYLENIKNAMKLDFICLLCNDAIVWASNYW